MMSDAPAHHLFCLLGPVDPNKKALPEILVVIQVRNRFDRFQKTSATAMNTRMMKIFTDMLRGSSK